MAVPPVKSFPVRRHECIENAYWNGNQGDSDLELVVQYRDPSNNAQTFVLQAGGDYPPSGARAFCLPANQKDPAKIHRDVHVAHIRMAAYLAHAVLGTKEFVDAILGTSPDNAANFQTALGADVQVTGVERLSETQYRLTLYCKNGGTTTIDVGHDEISEYSFTPSTQFKTLAGHIRKNLGFIHDPPSTVLSQAQMDEIVACVMWTGDYAVGQSTAAKRWMPFV